MTPETIAQISRALDLKNQGFKRVDIATMMGVTDALVKTRLSQVKAASALGYLTAPLVEVEIENQRVTDERAANNQLARNRMRDAYTIEGIIERIAEIHTPLRPMPPPSLLRRGVVHDNSEYWMIISDAHFGKGGDRYNTEMAKACVERFFLQAIKEVKNRKVHTLNIGLLGDILDGITIYRSQVLETELSATEQFTYVLQVLMDCISMVLADTDIKIDIIGIAGNHGRVNTPEIATWENFERLLYKTLEFFYKEESRVRFVLPETKEDFYVIHKGIFLFHGHEINGGGTIDGVAQRVRQWQTLYHERPFNISVCGHFHRLSSFAFPPDKLHLSNGTSVKGDMFIERLGASHSNSWWQFTTVPDSTGLSRIKDLVPVDLY